MSKQAPEYIDAARKAASKVAASKVAVGNVIDVNADWTYPRVVVAIDGNTISYASIGNVKRAGGEPADTEADGTLTLKARGTVACLAESLDALKSAREATYADRKPTKRKTSAKSKRGKPAPEATEADVAQIVAVAQLIATGMSKADAQAAVAEAVS